MAIQTTQRLVLKRARRQPLPLNLDTLRMMVMSGVVRRADHHPPLIVHRIGPPQPEQPHGTRLQESASEQGWLSRMILGRRPSAPVDHQAMVTKGR